MKPRRTRGRAAPALRDGDRRAELRMACEALWSTWQSTAAGEVMTLQALIDPNALTRALQSETTVKYGHCPQAKQALDTLVSAHSTYITPAGQRWFALKSRRHVNEHSGKKSAITDWYTRATEIMTDELGETNFYNVLMEVYYDRCLGGTGCMFIGGSDDTPLHFKHIALGSFAIAEDCYGNVSTLVRRDLMTAVQAVDAFGYDALPEQVRADYDNPSRCNTDKRGYLHLVRPRRGAVKKGVAGVPEHEREFEGFYLFEDDYTVIREEAYFEFPFLVTRFMRGNESPYGTAPGVAVIPTIRELKKLDRLMNVMAEKAAFPPMLQLASQNRQIDMRSGGITTVSKEEAQLGFPRELVTNGRYDIGLERIKEMVDQIRQAYFADILNAMNQVERPMTATEVNARMAEKVLAFSPSFHLFIYDYQRAARRILSILFRQGRLPEKGLPDDLFQAAEDGSGRLVMMNPQVCFLGKIAQAIERVQRTGIEDAMETIIAYTQRTQDPSMLQALKPRVIARYIVESSGAPSDIIRSDAELEAIDKRQEEQQQAAEQQQDALAAAEVVQKTGMANAGRQKGGRAA